jgi:hypothetical protein
MEDYKVTVWFSVVEGGWCVQETGNAAVYVYGTKRSALTAAEAKLTNQFKGLEVNNESK